MTRFQRGNNASSTIHHNRNGARAHGIRALVDESNAGTRFTRVVEGCSQKANRFMNLGASNSDSESSLNGAGGGSDNFPVHFVFFPTASFLSFEGFSVIAVVACITAIERRVVNLLPYPSLP
jgi:hypothetical protein